MSLKKIFAICVCGLSAVAGLLLFIPNIRLIGSYIQALASSAFLAGIGGLLMLAFAVLWLVFAVLGLIFVLIGKDENAGKKSKSFGSWCAKVAPLIFFVLGIAVVIGSLLPSNPEGALQYLQYLITQFQFYFVVAGAFVVSLFYAIARKQENKVVAAVLRGIGIVIVVISALFVATDLSLVAMIVGAVALAGEAAIPFLPDEKKSAEPKAE